MKDGIFVLIVAILIILIFSTAIMGEIPALILFLAISALAFYFYIKTEKKKGTPAAAADIQQNQSAPVNDTDEMKRELTDDEILKMANDQISAETSEQPVVEESPPAVVAPAPPPKKANSRKKAAKTEPEKADGRFCPSCGRNLEGFRSEMARCPYCAATLKDTEPVRRCSICGSELRGFGKNIKHCPYCASIMSQNDKNVRKCPKCASDLRSFSSNIRRCPYCAEKLKED